MSAAAPLANGKALTVLYDSRNNVRYYAYIDTNGDVQELSWPFFSPQLTRTNLSALSGAPPALNYVLAGADSPSIDRKDYVFVDANRHLWEVYYETGSPWRSSDLTTRTGAQLGSSLSLAIFWEPSSPAAFGGSRNIAFVDPNGSIWLISTYPLYKQECLRSFSQPPANLALTSYRTGFGYVDRSGRVREMRLGEMWELYDISARVQN